MPWLLAVVPVCFLGLFFVWPVASIIARGLDAGALGDVLGSARLRGIIWFTFWQALLCAAITLAVGLAPAVVLARYRFPGRRVLLAVVTVPFVLPTVVVGSAFLALLPTGWHRTVPAVIVAHVWVNISVVVRTVGSAVAQLDPALGDAAATLGAGPLQRLRHITLPLLAPTIGASGAVVFLFCFTSFGIVRLLGGPGRPTLEVEIWRTTTQLLDLRTAAVLALVQLVLVVSLMGLWAVFSARSAQPTGARPLGNLRSPSTTAQRWLTGITALATALVVVVPLVVLLTRSMRPSIAGWSLDAWRAVFGRASTTGRPTVDAPWESLLASLRIGIVATLIAATVGTLAACAVAGARRGGRLLDTGLMLPLGTSAVTVGFGLLITLDTPPFDLRGTWIMIPLGQALVALPFVVRVVLPALRSVDPGLREAAATLGAAPLRTWLEIDLPVIRRALGAAAGFALAMSLGEFGATSFLTRVGNETAPITIARLLGRPSQLNLATSSALATLLAAVTLLAILAVDRLRGEQGAGF